MTRGASPGITSHRTGDVDPMRLTDLILALKAQHGSASGLLQRIDPTIMDELRACAAHRQTDPMVLAADFLEQLACDAADTVWQLGIQRHADFDDDPEAALLGSMLQKAVRSRLQREHLIASATIARTVVVGFYRSGHPYTMA